MPVNEGRTSLTATADTITILHGSTVISVSFIGTSDPSTVVAEAGVVNNLLANG
jgi:hypothetical protein